MPVRDHAVELMMTQRYGTQVFNGITGECTTMPDYDERRKEMDAEYVELMERIDWHRILLVAAGRHLALDHDDLDHPDLMVDGLCGECVLAALLDRDRTTEWAE